MAAFLYFLPDLADQPTLKVCREWGLGYALEREPVASRVHGMLGKGGWIVADPDRIDVGRIAFHAEQQQWQKWKTAAGKEIYVGLYTAEPPGPGDLQRRSMLEGTPVELADGRMWQVPVARQWDADADPEYVIWSPALPRAATLDDEGNWRVKEVLPKYRELWQASVAYYDARLVQGEFNTLRGAAQALGANYLVDEAECSLLGVLSLEHALDVLDALVQWELAMQLFQKKTLTNGSGLIAGSASSSGPAAAAETIAPPSAT